MKITLVFPAAFLIAVFHLAQFANGLKCVDCYPCENEETDNPVKECDENGYQGLPDKGMMSCSVEVGARDSVRKRCLFLRDDPDNPGGRELTPQCFRSPMNKDKKDCVCFEDNCNSSPDGSGGDDELVNVGFMGNSGASSSEILGFWGIFLGFIAAIYNLKGVVGE